MKIRRSLAGLSIIAVALMLLSSAADAQVIDRGIQITAWGGPYSALGTLGGGNPAAGDVTQTQMKDGAGLGGSLEVPIPVDRLSVRGELAVVPSATMETNHPICPVGGSSRPEHCIAQSEGTLLMGVADLVYRTMQDYTRPHALFIIGFGLKNYSFEDDIRMRGVSEESSETTVAPGNCTVGDIVCQAHDRFTGSTTDPTLHLGAGLSVNAGPVNLIGEVGDYLSVYSHQSGGRELQELVHDVFLKVSAGVRVF